MLYKLLFTGTVVDSFATHIGLAGLRIYCGLSMALGHGMGKTRPSDGFAEGIADMGFPSPQFFAWAAGLLEFGGGILLALGLMTRPASLLIGVTMLVVAFIRHAADPFMHKKKALLFLAIASGFALIGVGKYSLDRVIGRAR